jgi:hypothetical protein
MKTAFSFGRLTKPCRSLLSITQLSSRERILFSMVAHFQVQVGEEVIRSQSMSFHRESSRDEETRVNRQYSCTDESTISNK